MKLGTISYEDKIYNLDYMDSHEIEALLNKVAENKKNKFEEGKKLLQEQ